MTKYFLIILSILFCSCCRVKTSDNGPLPASALHYVPYQNDSIYSLQHSDGSIIKFKTSRETREEISHCADCCYAYTYEVNTTEMIPDSSNLEIQIELSNDDSIILCFAYLNNYIFFIPTDTYQLSFVEIADSLVIDTVSYYEVLKLGDPQEPYNNEDHVKVDSLYYNYEYGILKILMSNSEYYRILR